MATLREIRRRISSVKSIEKITRAMKMVAAVKFRKAQINVLAARPYARKIDEIIRSLIPDDENIQNELLEEREVERVCITIVTADRGMAGAFNSNLIKYAENSIREKFLNYLENGNLSLICIGKKGFDFFSKAGYEIYAKYIGLFDRLIFNNAVNVVADILSGYREKKFDKVIMIYNEFKSAVQSRIIEEQFLPILSLEEPNSGELKVTTTNFIYEPAPKEIIDYLLPKHLNTQIWRILLESYASEQAARMTAMDSATNNATELIDTLQLFYNKARQSAITKELLEIVAGADALKESE
jgi:F-type H+-transporting ATPase subunit gamma